MIILDKTEAEKFFRSANTMTFTKAATAEIYTELLKKVYETIVKDDCENLNLELQKLGFYSNIVKSDLLEILKFLINNMSIIKITTIDSFMNSIVQSFPFELGLPGNCSIVDDGQQLHLQHKIINRLFDGKNKNLEEFRESCELALTANADKTHFEIFNNFIQMFDKLHVMHPDFVFEKYDKILSNREIKMRQKALEKNLFNCNEYFKNHELYHKNGKKVPLKTIFEMIVLNERLDLNFVFPTNVQAELKVFFEDWQSFIDEGKVKNYSKKWEFGPVKNDVLAILSLARDIVISQTAIRAEGIYQIYYEYRRLYKEEFYQKGYLTFNDLPKLLADENNDWTYDIAFRMNNRFSHWLLDEFQDTSRMQWRVLEKMIDIPDGESEKSLFFVGDSKQAIYSWRAGDRRLFDEVIDWGKLNWSLQQKPKNQSQRYGQNICQAINLIFDGGKMDQNRRLPGNMRDAWNGLFGKHEPAERLKYKSLFECIALDESATMSDMEAYAELIWRKIKETDLLAKGYSCAVLVRNKTEGRQLAKLLSAKEDLHKAVVWEGDESLSGDKFIVAMVSLLVYIQHPADTVSREVASLDVAVRHLLPANSDEMRVLSEELSNNGILYMIKKFIAELKSMQNIYQQKEINEYLVLDNLDNLLVAAKDFEAYSSDVDTINFRDFLDKRTFKSSIGGGKVKIMTVFRSKGLTYDFCFYAADCGGQRENITAFDYNHSTYFFDGKHLFYPMKKEHETVEDFKNALQNKLSDEVFESMCIAYVAMTRARYATYVILPPLSKAKQEVWDKGEKIYSKSKGSYYISDFIRDSLNKEDFVPGGYGELSFEKFSISNDFNILTMPQKIEKKSEHKLNFEFSETLGQRRKRISPSKLDDGIDLDGTEKLYFNLPQNNTASNLGDKIHELFAQVIDISSFKLPENIDEELKIELLSCMKNPEIRSLLRGENPQDVWIEKRFDCILENGWISGCFDRVNLKRDNSGNIVGAELIDYKSSLIDDETYELKLKKYQRQLNLYRDVLAKMLKLSVNDIECFIIFTRYGKLEKF